MNKRAQVGNEILLISLIILASSAFIVNSFLSKTHEAKDDMYRTTDTVSRRISNSLSLVQVSATDGSDKTLENFEFTLRLGSGSELLMFEDLYLTFTSGDYQNTYIYNESIDCSNFATIHPDYGFGISFAFKASNHEDYYMKRGDIIRLCFESEESIPDYTWFRVDFVVRHGVQSKFERRTPRNIIHTREVLFP